MQLSLNEVAKMFGVTEKNVSRWLKEEQLPGERLGGQWYFNSLEVWEWATQHHINVCPELPEQASPCKKVSLAQALKKGGGVLHLEGKSRKEVFLEISQQVELPVGFSSELLVDLLMSREMIGSTGVGAGMAIPHPCCPVVLPMECPRLILCYLKQGVDFGAFDNKPVETLFVLLSPSVSSHLACLSRLGKALQEAQFLNLIHSRTDSQAILDYLTTWEEGLPPSPLLPRE